MKKLLSILVACTVLTGCVAHETDLQAAQEDRDAQLLQKRIQNGCSFVRDHDAYRECLLNTYYSQHPQTYTTATLDDGEPVAVVSSKRKGCCSGGCSDEIRGMPAAGPQIVPYTSTESTTVETSCTHDYEQQEAVISTEEVIPVGINAPVAPAPVIVEQPVAPEKPIIEENEATWWESYQENKPQTVAPVEPKCPCDDPNDPCPQCYDK